jgi:hypothetical protein
MNKPQVSSSDMTEVMNAEKNVTKSYNAVKINTSEVKPSLVKTFGCDILVFFTKFIFSASSAVGLGACFFKLFRFCPLMRGGAIGTTVSVIFDESKICFL